jgi:hypothetical protein
MKPFTKKTATSLGIYTNMLIEPKPQIIIVRGLVKPRKN